jgi:hypothetical protein
VTEASEAEQQGVMAPQVIEMLQSLQQQFMELKQQQQQTQVQTLPVQQHQEVVTQSLQPCTSSGLSRSSSDGGPKEIQQVAERRSRDRRLSPPRAPIIEHHLDVKLRKYGCYRAQLLSPPSNTRITTDILGPPSGSREQLESRIEKLGMATFKDWESRLPEMYTCFSVEEAKANQITGYDALYMPRMTWSMTYSPPPKVKDGTKDQEAVRSVEILFNRARDQEVHLQEIVSHVDQVITNARRVYLAAMQQTSGKYYAIHSTTLDGQDLSRHILYAKVKAASWYKFFRKMFFAREDMLAILEHWYEYEQVLEGFWKGDRMTEIKLDEKAEEAVFVDQY